MCRLRKSVIGNAVRNLLVYDALDTPKKKAAICRQPF